MALVVPGGVDRSGEVRVIPALLALIKRLAARHELHVIALGQEREAGQWRLHGASVRNIGGRSSTLAQVRAVAALLNEHRVAPFDLVQSLWSGGSGLVAVTAAKLLAIPSAVHVAGGELIALPAIGYGGRQGPVGRLREALVLNGAGTLSAASAPMLAQLAALGHSAQRLPLGVDLEAWLPQPPQRRGPQERLRLIHVASLNRVKDQPTLLRALAHLGGADFQLDIVGEDTLGGRVQALAAQLGLARRCTFHGFMTQAQLRPLLARAHIHVLSSLHEAGPLVLLEAAVLGVPSVGTRVGHLAEWAQEREPAALAALAVDPGDAAALGQALKRLMEDEALRLRIAAAAQRRALQEDADHTAALFERLHAALRGGAGS